MVTTNKAFSEWNQVFAGAACVATLIDRLCHRVEVVTIEGKSYRAAEALARSKDKADKTRQEAEEEMKRMRTKSVTERLSPSERLDLWAELQHAAWHILSLTDEWWDDDLRMREENDRRCGLEKNAGDDGRKK